MMKRLCFVALAFAPCVALAARARAAGDDVLPGPPTFYQWVLPLEYDGTGFRVPATFKPCGKPWDATPYVVSKTHDVVSNGPILFMPGCASSSDRLYIVAERLRTSETNLHYVPKASFPAFAIAGPAYAGEDPWTFTPIEPAVTLHAGERYVFFIARIVAI